MASTYSNLYLQLMGTGDQAGAWGATTNYNLQYIDNAISGTSTIALTSAYTVGSPFQILTTGGSAGTPAPAGGQSRALIFTGSPGITTYVQFYGSATSPNTLTAYFFVKNATTNPITFLQCSAGTTVTVQSGAEALIRCDGGGNTNGNVLTLFGATAPNYLTGTAGTANAITAISTASFTRYFPGQVFQFVAALGNTGAATLTVTNGANTALATANITKKGTIPLISGDILAGAVVSVTYDGTQFQLSGSGGGSGGGATGGGGDTVFQVNSLTITTSYSVPSGSAASSVGPITINTGAVITVPTGSKWVVL